MKKLIFILLMVVIGALLLSGCSGSQVASDTKDKVKMNNSTNKMPPKPLDDNHGTKNAESVIYRGNLQRTGIYPSLPVGESATLAWKFKTDGSSKYSRVESKGLVSVGGVNYISPPVLYDGIMYFTCSDGYLYAVHPRTGEENWRVRINERGLDWYVSIPAVDKGMIYVTDGEILNAIEIATRQVKWRHAGTCPPAISDGLVLVGSWEYKDKGKGYYFCALDAETGKEKWRLKTEDCVYNSPAVDNGLVFIVTRSNTSFYVHAIEIESGNEKWRFCSDRGNFYEFSTPVVYKGMVFIGGSYSNGIIYALDAETGRRVWQRQVFGSPGNTKGSDLAVDEGLVVLTGDYDAFSIYALDAANGQEKWKFASRSIIYGSPVISNGVVYFGALENLRALDLKTGKERWSFSTGGPAIVSSPVVYDGMIYFGCEDGCLYALK